MGQKYRGRTLFSTADFKAAKSLGRYDLDAHGHAQYDAGTGTFNAYPSVTEC
jgi:hypothetical protein